MDDWHVRKINAYCRSQFSDRFKCELRRGKGRVLIATSQGVRKGCQIFKEPLLHSVHEEPDNEAFRLLQRMCTDSDVFYKPLWYWAALCSLTQEQLRTPPKCGTLKPLASEEQQRSMLCLFHEPVRDASEAMDRIVATLELEVEPRFLEELLQIWILNSFQHSSSPAGLAVYFASSFISHSCAPNACWHKDNLERHVLVALRDIAPGDEVTMSYLEKWALLHSVERRRRSLRETKLFRCNCERCGGEGGDPCRGFRCPACRRCGIFYRRQCGRGAGLQGVACTKCGAHPTEADIQRILEAESTMETRLDNLDRESSKGICKTSESEGTHMLLEMLDGDVGPQHWLANRAVLHLKKRFRLEGHDAGVQRMAKLRKRYKLKAFEASFET